MALEDAQRTVRLIRFHASEYHIDSHKVGVLGFSAGGYLVADISPNFDKRLYPLVERPLDVGAKAALVFALSGDVESAKKMADKLAQEHQLDTGVQYYSVEQVRGLPIDSRSDIFSFGVILYQLLTGQRPFQGTSSPDTMSAILREDPPEISELNPKLSLGLALVVRHCLEKRPED